MINVELIAIIRAILKSLEVQNDAIEELYRECEIEPNLELVKTDFETLNGQLNSIVALDGVVLPDSLG